MIPDSIIRVNVTDTCAVWHVVGADTLFRAALRVNITFVITPTIAYECFVKTRGKHLDPQRQALREKLRTHLDEGSLSETRVSIEDLQEAIHAAKRTGCDKRLGQGELSCVALARRLGHAAVLTDNKRDFRAIESLVEGRLQKTPQLLGWLYVEDHINDTDVDGVVQEHQASGGHMAQIFQQAHHQACEKKLMRKLMHNVDPPVEAG